ncbi:MAG: sugar ABC transporter permease [Candidatus Omnitrophica bacterium]|nr:sugar ABC transporter permease [Candidatus Omnitrophota bacterium]
MTEYTTNNRFSSFSFIIPALVIFAVFYLYPFFYSFALSLYEGDGISTMRFVGLNNYKTALCLDREWWRSMYNGAFITFLALTLQNILAFALALGVNKTVRTNKIYCTVFFILPVLSEIIIGLLMREILKSDPGVFNQILGKIGLGGFASNWLEGEKTALLTTALVHCWRGFGWAFVIILAGLQTIPEQLYEAARIDGANAWHKFTKITIPLLMPVLSLVFILTILGTMQVFTMILALTRGAGGLTEVPVMRIYNHLRGGRLIGYACTEGVVLGVILIAVSFVTLYISKQMRKHYGVLPN